MITLDQDSLLVIFEHLSMQEKLKCRLICHKWRIAIDKLIAGQQFLEINAVNSSVAAAAAKASGTVQLSRVGQYRMSFETVFEHIKRLLSSLNWKLLPEETIDTADAARASNTNSGYAMSNNSKELDLLNVCSPSNLIYLSSYYWSYAFCASSSLFSSYAFAISTITDHKYFHSFCDCYPRKRHKYSVMLDRDQLTFEVFNTLLCKFNNIQSLVIRNVDQMSDIFLYTITQHCDKVQSLSFTNCSGLKKDKDNQHSSFNCLTNYGWKLLSRAYPNLTSLTLRQCKLNDVQLTVLIQNSVNLRFLDISDNIQIGKSVRYLGPQIKCLICGDLSSNESIETILSNIAFGNGRHLEYLSLFGLLGSLKAFNEFDQLTQLELHFFTDEELPNYLAEIGVLSLTSLVLEQIRCYESPSAINHVQFEKMLEKSSQLKRLQITGDFDWNLRLNDDSLKRLTSLCPSLQELTLNGNGSLSDTGIIHLSSLPLVQLSLSSFYTITDYSIKTLLKNMFTLQQVTLVDMPQITDGVLSKAIVVCKSDHERKINITLSNEQLSKHLREYSQTCPSNLTFNFDSHLCGKQYADSEPTDIQMLLIIVMSVVILAMTLLTTVVVILVPLSMLLMMAQEYLIDLILNHLPNSSLTDILPRIHSDIALASTTCDTNTIYAFLLSSINKILSFAIK